MSHDLRGKRIAIVRLSAIGDVVHVLPIAASIRAAAPDAHISWLIQPTPFELVRYNPWVDEFILFERNALLRSYGRLIDLRRAERFDLVVAPHTSIKAGLATALLKAPRKVGYDRKRAPELNWLFTNERIGPHGRGHAQEEMFEFVDHLGIPRVLAWGLEPTPEERVRYGPLLPTHEGPTIALVVGSSLPAKDWPAPRFAELADRLSVAFGARCILVGGRTPAENAAAARIAGLAAAAPRDLREWDLRRLAFLLSRADVVVSPDSGPLHIAVALGTPTVALMGYTNPKRYGPYRSVELMIDSFSDPGEEYGADAAVRPGRMERITVEEVFERVGRALATGHTPS